jgi:hypothetical protein
MTKKKVGLVLFWASVIWAILWGVVVSVSNGPYFHNLTFEELNQSIWAMTGPLRLFWGIFGTPLGALVVGIGLLLYSGAKGSTVWKFGIGIVLAFIISTALTFMGYFPPLFGVGGTLILLFFFGILWFWAKERMALKGQSAAAADLKLVGYVFMFIGSVVCLRICPPAFLESL